MPARFDSRFLVVVALSGMNINIYNTNLQKVEYSFWKYNGPSTNENQTSAGIERQSNKKKTDERREKNLPLPLRQTTATIQPPPWWTYIFLLLLFLLEI